MSDGKRGAGRPPYEPSEKDRAFVKTLTGYGIPDYEIAAVLNMTPPTLRKYYSHELQIGHTEMNAKVASSLYRRAIGDGPDAVKAAMFWLERRAGWKPPPREYVEQPGKREIVEREAQEAMRSTPWAQLLQ